MRRLCNVFLCFFSSWTMSSKSKKTVKAADWVQCKKCGLQLLARDSSLHDEDTCRTSSLACSQKDLCLASGVKHGFVARNIVCGEVVRLKKGVNHLKPLPVSKKKQLVLLNPTVLKFARLAIGDKIILHSMKCIPMICTSWPSSTESNGMHPTNIILPVESKFDDCVDSFCIVERFKGPYVTATQVKLKASCSHDYHHSNNFKHHLLDENDNSFVTLQSILHCQYFGQQCKFKVMAIESENGDSLSTSTDESELFETTVDKLNFDSLNLDSIPSVDSFSTSTPKRNPNDSTFLNENFIPSDDVNISLQKLNDSTADVKSESLFFQITSRTVMDVVDKSSNKKCDDGSNDIKPIKFSDIGALAKQLESIIEILQPNDRKKRLKSQGFKLPKNILMFGPPGTGKTMIGRAIANEMNYHFIVINGPEVYSKYFGETESNLKNIFQEAKSKSPCMIFIDEIDALCPKRESIQSEQEKRVVATLLSLLDELADEESDVMVIAATNKPDSLDIALRRPGRLDKEVEIGIPDAGGRFEILSKILSKVQHCLTQEQIKFVADGCHGYTGADLNAICSEAGAHALKTALLRHTDSKLEDNQALDGVQITPDDMRFSQQLIKPSVMREIRLEIPKVHWEDIGGQHDLKKKLKQAVEWPIKHPEAFQRMGIKPPSGILMYGPPGCSKTMIAKALATESGLNFFSIKGPELFSKWVGESERAVREVFRKARAASPAIVFFDEIDVLAGERGSSSVGNNVGDRVLTQLLTEMDGVEYLQNVIIVAATNRPDMIDKALMRPGRLDRIIYVPLPDEEGRRQIFQIQFKKTPVASDVSIDDLARRTCSYSGAEIVSVCQEACLLAMEDNIDVECVSTKFFDEALKSMTPRIKPELIKFYEDFQNSSLKT